MLAQRAHTQRTHAVVEAEREGASRILTAEIESSRHLPRLPRGIFLRTAPMPSGEPEVSHHVYVERETIAKHSLNTDVRIIYPLQLFNGRQTPAAEARKLQTGAIVAGLVPVHIPAVVLLAPHESGDGVGPGQHGVGIGSFSGGLSRMGCGRLRKGEWRCGKRKSYCIHNLAHDTDPPMRHILAKRIYTFKSNPNVGALCANISETSCPSTIT